MQIPLFITN